MRYRAFALASLAALLAGCKTDLPVAPVSPLPDVSGKWSYATFDMRVPGSGAGKCEIDGVTLDIGAWELKGFRGRTSGGVFRCDGELSGYSGPLPSYPILEGGMVLPDASGYIPANIAFSISTSNWRHEGELSHDTVRTVQGGRTVTRLEFGDTMRGVVRLRTGGVELHGTFRAVRLKDGS